MMMAPAQPASTSCSLAWLLERELPVDANISGICLDSRRVRAGDVFLAIAGAVHDGRAFIEQAVANGAAAVVADAPVAGFVDAVPVPLVEIPDLSQEAGAIAARFYGDPTRTMRVVGVTGTNGKTTTSRLVAQLLRAGGRPCGVIGTLGAALDDRVAEAVNTTPDAVGLQACFADWREHGVRDAAMEVSSHALVQGRVAGVHFDTAVFTNLSRDHLDYHGDMEAYARAKLRLFASEGLRHALVNHDDAYGGVFRATAAAPTVLSYSAAGDRAADLYIDNLRYSTSGATGRLHTPWGVGEFVSPLPGVFNVANLMAAVGCTVLAGDELSAVLGRLAGLRPVPGRLQSVANDCGLQVLVDYAHTPDALEQVLRALRPNVAGRLITVVGCGGDRDAGKRPVMGRLACELSDAVVLTSDNPRSEDPESIIDDIAAGCVGPFQRETDRASAIALAIAAAAPGDCVLIAGKGHEDYQIIEGQRLHFSDVEQAELALARRAQS
ncbi:UDP-N-acetylmuramoyl-L-alanyl-D-glutamate--2,6-diaminopimelate ligase [Parahaliea mediterranea]|uniref:UDP-N-acetylmuramoyl-L-alanyl-D-glutamate--2, 6-diaminopimelate ligase n=1 Tax=Parahaliea mediterranea TaxID=651086 RepID=UPI0019D4CE06|nr:UDP-N-acetylmuramoyl-L-alanyl-D-glutamate--2,6-diaminopimelate ligase [Parahaliea mediterranea]